MSSSGSSKRPLPVPLHTAANDELISDDNEQDTVEEYDPDSQAGEQLNAGAPIDGTNLQTVLDTVLHHASGTICDVATELAANKGERPRDINRNCLVCGDPTRIAHLGIDACRACAVFYRRAKQGNDFVCRSAAEQCSSKGKVRSCKRCRFDSISELLSHSAKRALVSLKQSPRSAQSSGSSETPLLDNLRVEYKSMCFAQLCSELHARTDVPHPMQISLEKGPFFPADFASITLAHRILLATSIRFGDEVFPEFSGLTESERWKIVKNFMFPYRGLEGSLRANKVFPNEPYKSFPSFATYFNAKSDTNFFSTAPQNGDTAAAERFLHSPEFADMIPEIREEMKRVNPTHEEFLALVVFTFWDIEDLDMSEAAMSARTHYREAVLKELHVIYRRTLQLEDYAARLGELMILQQYFKQKYKLHEHLELFRLYDVMGEDNFVYAIQNED